MYLTEIFFYSAVYGAWCVGLLLGTILAFFVTKQNFSAAEKEYQNAKTSLMEQNSHLVGDIKLSRLAGLRDARAILRKSQNLNDADKKLADIERRVEAN
jgi:hypothetical protein